MVMADPTDLGHGKKGCLMVLAGPSDLGHGKNGFNINIAQKWGGGHCLQ